MKNPKVLSDSYLYKVTSYEKEIMRYLMEAKRIDKESELFADVAYNVKMRQISPIITKVLFSHKVELLLDNKGMSRPFKVIYAKDVKNGSTDKKVFIDCTGIIVEKDDGKYECKKIFDLISHLLTGLIYFLYYKATDKVLSNNTIIQNGANMFVDMMLYILSGLKVPTTYSDNKNKMGFVLAEYFLYCMVGKDSDEDNINIAKKVAALDNKTTADYYHTLFFDTYNDGEGDIKEFIAKFAEVFLDQKNDKSSYMNRTPLTIESVISAWMTRFGASTYLGIELFVPFAEILSDVYVGGYLNSQKNIENVSKMASKYINNFTNEIIKLGSENV